MIDSADISAKAEALQAELKRAFGIRGGSLAVALRKAGRRLPKRLHERGAEIVEAQGLMEHPKLSRGVNHDLISRGYVQIMDYLNKIEPEERRKDMWLGIAGSMAMNILIVGCALLVLLTWRGLI